MCLHRHGCVGGVDLPSRDKGWRESSAQDMHAMGSFLKIKLNVCVCARARACMRMCAHVQVPLEARGHQIPGVQVFMCLL